MFLRQQQPAAVDGRRRFTGVDQRGWSERTGQAAFADTAVAGEIFKSPDANQLAAGQIIEYLFATGVALATTTTLR